MCITQKASWDLRPNKLQYLTYAYKGKLHQEQIILNFHLYYTIYIENIPTLLK